MLYVSNRRLFANVFSTWCYSLSYATVKNTGYMLLKVCVKWFDECVKARRMIILTDVNKGINLLYKHKVSRGKKVDKINLMLSGIKENLLSEGMVPAVLGLQHVA